MVLLIRYAFYYGQSFNIKEGSSMVKIKMLILMVSLRDSGGIVGVVCISSQASPGREKYTGGVCRVYRKVYRVAAGK